MKEDKKQEATDESHNVTKWKEKTEIWNKKGQE